MCRKASRSLSLILTALTLILVGPIQGIALAEFQERVTLEGDELTLSNLIGEIQVRGHDGSSFEIELRVQGQDGSRERIQVETKEGAQASFAVLFPVDSERRYVYPKLGPGSKARISVPSESNSDGSWLKKIFGSLGRHQVQVSGKGSGLEVWADATVKVPRGKSLRVQHGLGEIYVEEVEGELSLGIQSGGVRAGSIQGDLSIDTGSGRVEVEDVAGGVSIDTGSGHVSLSRAEGSTLVIDTGSGRVQVDTVTCRRLSIDTGSGSVHARSVSAESVSIDTGSGGVDLELSEIGQGRYEVDTGSGSITLTLPANASAEVEADTGSGGIQLGLQDVQIFHKERNELAFRVGDGGAKVRLDTGSGAIRINP